MVIEIPWPHQPHHHTKTISPRCAQQALSSATPARPLNQVLVCHLLGRSPAAATGCCIQPPPLAIAHTTLSMLAPPCSYDPQRLGSEWLCTHFSWPPSKMKFWISPSPPCSQYVCFQDQCRERAMKDPPLPNVSDLQLGESGTRR